MADETKPWHRPGGGFVNPWPSATLTGFFDGLRLLADVNKREMMSTPVPEKQVTVVPMNFEAINNPPTESSTMQLTWLGHASFLLQVEGVNILLDPILSHRCSPFSFMGPARFRPTPCQIADLPKADIVIISHNHYDHLDEGTIKALGRDALYLVPLGIKRFFTSRGFENVREMDWWESTTVGSLVVSCTPTQHFSGRWLHDRDETLWASWVVQGASSSFYFAGDTGYRSVPRGFTGDEDDLPACPAFREIGERFGPFDLACIPIGAYSPRWFMSRVHCSPEDAVCVHRDVRSRKSIGMHWGTFRLTDEEVDEPPRRMRAAAEKKGLAPGEFDVMDIGATIVVRDCQGSERKSA